MLSLTSGSPMALPTSRAFTARTTVSSGQSQAFSKQPSLQQQHPFSAPCKRLFFRLRSASPPRSLSGKCIVFSFFKFGSPQPKLPEVVTAGDPVLGEPAAPVPLAEITSPPVQRIIDDMIAVMRAVPGVGLAAPQLGIPLQIIVLEDTKEYISYVSKEDKDAQQRYPFDLLVICNPTLKECGTKRARFFEGCLSVNGYRALVERHLEVEVSGYGRDGLPITVKSSGWQARILQHECDHLKGVLYVEKMVPKTFRSNENLKLPLPSGCPKPGVC